MTYFFSISPVPHICGDKYMFASHYMRSRTGRLLLERLAEEESRQAEIDKTSVSADLMSHLSQCYSDRYCSYKEHSVIFIDLFSM